MKVEVRSAQDVMCQECTGQLCLTAHLPGRDRTVVLCPTCDSTTPQARELLDYFAVNPSVRPEDASRVSELLSHWLEAATAEQERGSLAADVANWWARRLS